jgi:hypothetical protein
MAMSWGHVRAGESGPQMGRAVEKQVRWFWRFVMMPVLFGLVGASINFATIEGGMIPKACAIIIAGSIPPPLNLISGLSIYLCCHNRARTRGLCTGGSSIANSMGCNQPDCHAVIISAMVWNGLFYL